MERNNKIDKWSSSYKGIGTFKTYEFMILQSHTALK